MMSFVKMRMRKEAMKNNELSSSDHFRPMVPGRGANRIGPTSPPIGRRLPIHESCSSDGTKSNGESDRSWVNFVMTGDDHPMVVPHDIPMMFAAKEHFAGCSFSQLHHKQFSPTTAAKI